MSEIPFQLHVEEVAVPSLSIVNHLVVILIASFESHLAIGEDHADAGGDQVLRGPDGILAIVTAFHIPGKPRGDLCVKQTNKLILSLVLPRRIAVKYLVEVQAQVGGIAKLKGEGLKYPGSVIPGEIRVVVLILNPGAQPAPVTSAPPTQSVSVSAKACGGALLSTTLSRP